MDWDQIKETANERRLVGNIKGISRESQENDKGFDQAGLNLKRFAAYCENRHGALYPLRGKV